LHRRPQLLSASVARTGIARLETAAPIAGAVSQIVMMTLSSPTNSFAPVAQAPTLVPARRRSAAVSAPGDPSPATRRRSYEVDVGWPPVGANTRDVSVRVSYLVIPGGT
jgi:hypothetical protein